MFICSLDAAIECSEMTNLRVTFAHGNDHRDLFTRTGIRENTTPYV